MFYPKSRAAELNVGDLVLTKCPGWCPEGFQIATWNGSIFEYESQPNDWFDKDVTEFMILSEDGDVLEFKDK